jgi:hypothetical protein
MPQRGDGEVVGERVGRGEGVGDTDGDGDTLGDGLTDGDGDGLGLGDGVALGVGFGEEVGTGVAGTGVGAGWAVTNEIRTSRDRGRCSAVRAVPRTVTS